MPSAEREAVEQLVDAGLPDEAMARLDVGDLRRTEKTPCLITEHLGGRLRRGALVVRPTSGPARVRDHEDRYGVRARDLSPRRPPGGRAARTRHDRNFQTPPR